MSDFRSGRLVFPLQITLIVLLISSLGFIGAVVELSQTRQSLNLAEQELADVKNLILERQQLVELVRAISRHRDFLDDMEARLARGMTQSELVEDIERMLDRREIVVEDQSYSPVMFKNGERTIRQAIKLRSDYRALRDFVAGLESTSRGVTVIDQIEIQKGDRDTLATSIQLTSFLGQE